MNSAMFKSKHCILKPSLDVETTTEGVDARGGQTSGGALVSRHSPRRCSPKVNFLEGGLVESHSANREKRIPSTSASMCTASVMMARLFDT